MSQDSGDDFNRNKLGEIWALETKIKSKKRDWLIILFVGTMMFSSCGICTMFAGHDINGLTNPATTSKDTALVKTGNTNQTAQEQQSYIESLNSADQQSGDNPLSNDPGSADYGNIINIISVVNADNGTGSTDYDQMINAFKAEYGSDYGDLYGL